MNSSPASFGRMSPASFSQFQDYIQEKLGIRVPLTKRLMLESRLLKRLRQLGMSSFDEYCRYLFDPGGNPAEIRRMIDAVTTNKTDFFRETDHFTYLLDSGLDSLLSENPIPTLNLWSAAASSGEESYTMAMILEEFRKKTPADYFILATDISEEILDRGRQGIYTETAVDKIPKAYRSQYLLKSRNRTNPTYRIKPHLRSRVLFRKLNLIDVPYPLKKRYHIIFCRNVLIYFNQENQRTVIRNLYSHLAPGGLLFLGHAETLAGLSLPLEYVAPTLYRKKND